MSFTPRVVHSKSVASLFFHFFEQISQMFTVRARLLKKQSALNLEEKNAHGSVIYDQWLVLTSSGNKLEEQQFLI